MVKQIFVTSKFITSNIVGVYNIDFFLIYCCFFIVLLQIYRKKQIHSRLFWNHAIGIVLTNEYIVLQLFMLSTNQIFDYLYVLCFPVAVPFTNYAHFNLYM